MGLVILFDLALLLPSASATKSPGGLFPSGMHWATLGSRFLSDDRSYQSVCETGNAGKDANFVELHNKTEFST